jgi:transcriptional regulator with XRE-family HTH domain
MLWGIFFTQKNQHNMSGIKTIRDYFGLTQQELAVFLGVSSSMLSMAEIKHRLLPTYALVKLNLLDAQVQQPKALASHKAVAPHVKKYTTHYTDQILAQHKEMQYKTALHKKKMEAMKKQHEQAVQTLALVHALQHTSSKLPANKKDTAWLEVIEKKAAVHLKNTHPILQANAQIKMELLQQESDLLQTLLQNQMQNL